MSDVLRRLALLVALLTGLTACGSATPGSSGPGDDAPARVDDLSEIARFGLLSTDGEPLIDPTELIDAASFDGIPSVDDPVVVPVSRADGPLSDTEQLMLVVNGGVARAYPVRSLIRHEIVNDVVGGLPVAVTWCPLCNTGITFDRRVDGRAEVFGVSGGLYRSALVMFDRRTTSLWPQPLGQAVLGPLLGEELAGAPGSASPLETQDVREGRDVGSTGVYDPRVDGRLLTFRASGGTQFSDRETGSRWSLAGLAIEGPLTGTRLSALPHQDAFWFAWAAFQPDTVLVRE